MKITIVLGAFLPVPPQRGGAVEKRWFALAKEFAGRGHTVTQISRKWPGFPDEEWVDGVLHRRVRGYAAPASGIYLKWLDLLYTLRAKAVIPADSDVIVTNSFWAPIVLSLSFKKRCMVDVARMPKGQMKLYRQAPRLRANSNAVADAIRKELPAHLRNRVVVIPNPLPFHGLREVDFSSKKRVLLYAGRVHPEKGLELLIKAFKSMQTDWKLKIVGPWEYNAGGGGAPYKESLRQLAEQANIEFIGPVFDAGRLNQFYAEASIFVYPSVAEKGETFGLAPLEAMAWGCVPLVSALDCFKDFIINGKNGVVFDHRSGYAVEQLKYAIEHVQNNIVFRLALAMEAVKVRQSHSIPHVASLFLKDFETMV